MGNAIAEDVRETKMLIDGVTNSGVDAGKEACGPKDVPCKAGRRGALTGAPHAPRHGVRRRSGFSCKARREASGRRLIAALASAGGFVAC